MKIIPNFPQYSISEDGKTLIGNGRIKKILSNFIDKDGYHKASIYHNKKRVCTTVHRLVAFTYLENPLKLPQINHIDGNKSNNHYSNLEWCDALHNNRHAQQTGLRDNANRLLSERNKLNPKSKYSSMGKVNRKLSDNDIRLIRNLFESKQKTYKELAIMFNYDSSSIGKIIRRERYSEIE